ncbi:peroxiredoxin family protein [Achromobacter spanius]|uniref:peroxiredoxin family protein n=1 Tax=Achromobacter spanius TaxID=217203 RepID=UPI0038083E3F
MTALYDPRQALPAPALQTTQWLNTPHPIDLAALRGKVVVLHAFQMLCPGCVMHGLPQAERVHRLFRNQDVAVIGLHSVFEHHAVMTPQALEAFVHEYRWSFPIGIDQPDGHNGIPLTMRTYALRGTPSLILIDREGRMRLHHFGHLDDLVLGAAVGQLLSEPAGVAAGRDESETPSIEASGDCAQGLCAVRT